MSQEEIQVAFHCPGCGTPAEYRGEYRARIQILCGTCGEDVTQSFKRAFFRGIAADLNASIVERENRAFLEYLARGWNR